VTAVGGLDLPVLGTSAVVLAGDAAIPAFEVYAANNATDERACGFAAACIEHLGGRPNLAWSVTAEDRRSLAEMLQVAEQLRNLWVRRLGPSHPSLALRHAGRAHADLLLKT
jgi:hypothetical protein